MQQDGQVSVVIPAYNAENYIRRALYSVMEQSFRPCEIIVVDDGSIDNTVKIAQSYGAQVISVPNGGPSQARNKGVLKASGEYIAFLDADDIWSPNKLKTQLELIGKYTLPSFSFTDYLIFDSKNGIHTTKSPLMNNWGFKKTLKKSTSVYASNKHNGMLLIKADGSVPVLYDSFIQPSTVVLRRKDFFEVGGFNESLRVTEDYEFFLRLYKQAAAFVVLQPLMLYRRHSNQATSNGPLNKQGFIEVAKMVLSNPSIYPTADANNLINNIHMLHYNLGITYARLGEFDEAIKSFEDSLIIKWNLPATIALSAAQVCKSEIGRSTFTTVKTIWKKRHGKH